MSYLAAILAWFASWFANADLEAARCAAAVHVAAASLRAEQPRPEPKPKPKVCPDCKGTGLIVHGDGHRTRCPCGVPVKVEVRDP